MEENSTRNTEKSPALKELQKDLEEALKLQESFKKTPPLVSNTGYLDEKITKLQADIAEAEKKLQQENVKSSPPQSPPKGSPVGSPLNNQGKEIQPSSPHGSPTKRDIEEGGWQDRADRRDNGSGTGSRPSTRSSSPGRNNEDPKEQWLDKFYNERLQTEWDHTYSKLPRTNRITMNMDIPFNGNSVEMKTFIDKLNRAVGKTSIRTITFVKTENQDSSIRVQCNNTTVADFAPEGQIRQQYNELYNKAKSKGKCLMM